jgi:2-polyprenyl-3-methyl-5-hydroxy-6-metoxy-1,4-benzoquinol methylase
MSSPSNVTKTHQQEIADGERFSFGANWTQFLSLLDDARIERAIDSLKEYLEVDDLRGKSFLDIGSGSGLFSLAAKRLGAKVTSFDFDPKSVACTQELKRRYYSEDKDWQIQIGSVLDKRYMDSLGKFDVVYSWGVLHHTGNMWIALANVDGCVKAAGILFIAIYNDQGRASKVWKAIKRAYISLPSWLCWIVVIPCYVRLWGAPMARDFFSLTPFKTWRTYKKNRGMSPHHDVIDWVGGYPFEVAKPEEIFIFYRVRGFNLNILKTCAGGIGCNEFVFKRNS